METLKLFVMMNILTWNVRGLGSKSIKECVKNILQRQKVNLLVIQETKLAKFSFQEARRLWDKRNFGFVHRNAEGRSRGILVAWNKDTVDVSEVCMGRFSISIKFFLLQCPLVGCFQGFMGL